MNAADFNKMMEALNTRIESCERYFSLIKSTDDLKLITLDMAAELKQFCLEEEVIMTKIAMVDLYHIIGMGNLTPPQMMQFTYKIQTYLSYRPSIKAIAKKFDSILDLPAIPVTTKFKLLALCDLTLSNGEGPEEYADISDYMNLSKQVVSISAPELPYSLEGNMITVQKNKIEDFLNTLKNLYKTNFSLNKLRSRILSRTDYAGIRWQTETEDTVVGRFISENAKNKLIQYSQSRD